MIAIALLILGATSVDDAMARYREQTVAGPRCAVARSDTDITVCGRRNADRYRVPLVIHDAGDPKYQGVPADRERLLARTSNCEEKSIFLVGCGKVSVSVGTKGLLLGGERPLAP
jgi:hypothetical protein